MATKKTTVPAPKTKPKRASTKKAPNASISGVILASVKPETVVVGEIFPCKPKTKRPRKKLPPGTPRLSKDKRTVIESGENLSEGVRSPPKKNPPPKTEPEIPGPDSEPVAELLTPRQECFVLNYVVNDRLRGN